MMRWALIVPLILFGCSEQVRKQETPDPPPMGRVDVEAGDTLPFELEAEGALDFAEAGEASYRVQIRWRTRGIGSTQWGVLFPEAGKRRWQLHLQVPEKEGEHLAYGPFVLEFPPGGTYRVELRALTSRCLKAPDQCPLGKALNVTTPP